MNGDPIFDEYLQEVARTLRHQSRLSRRIVDEVKDHLHEAADELMQSGVDRETATRMAIQRFGSPKELVERFELEAPLESEVDTMLRYALMSLTALTFLFGAMMLLGSWFDDAPSLMHWSKLIAAMLVMICGVILFHQGWARRPLYPWERAVALAAALLSIVIGSMGGVFTAHLGLVTHDWEMYGFAGAGLLVLQGTISVIDLVLANAPSRQEMAC